MQNNSPKLTGAALMGSQNSERREVPRYPFVASAEQIDVNTGTQLSARASELSLKGCYLDTLNPFPQGTQIRLVIFHCDASFTALARVIYSLRNLGMGVLFKSVEPEQLETLRTWLAELNRGGCAA